VWFSVLSLVVFGFFSSFFFEVVPAAFGAAGLSWESGVEACVLYGFCGSVLEPGAEFHTFTPACVSRFERNSS